MHTIYITHVTVDPKFYYTLMFFLDVEIHWHAKGFLLVIPLRKDDFGIGGSAEYEVNTVSKFFSN